MYSAKKMQQQLSTVSVFIQGVLASSIILCSMYAMECNIAQQKNVMLSPLNQRSRVSNEFIDAFVTFVLSLDKNWLDDHQLRSQIQLIQDPFVLFGDSNYRETFADFMPSLNKNQQFLFLKLLFQNTQDLFDTLKALHKGLFEENKIVSVDNLTILSKNKLLMDLFGAHSSDIVRILGYHTQIQKLMEQHKVDENERIADSFYLLQVSRNMHHNKVVGAESKTAEQNDALKSNDLTFSQFSYNTEQAQEQAGWLDTLKRYRSKLGDLQEYMPSISSITTLVLPKSNPALDEAIKKNIKNARCWIFKFAYLFSTLKPNQYFFASQLLQLMRGNDWNSILTDTESDVFIKIIQQFTEEQKEVLIEAITGYLRTVLIHHCESNFESNEQIEGYEQLINMAFGCGSISLINKDLDFIQGLPKTTSCTYLNVLAIYTTTRFYISPTKILQEIFLTHYLINKPPSC